MFALLMRPAVISSTCYADAKGRKKIDAPCAIRSTKVSLIKLAGKRMVQNCKGNHMNFLYLYVNNKMLSMIIIYISNTILILIEFYLFRLTRMAKNLRITSFLFKQFKCITTSRYPTICVFTRLLFKQTETASKFCPGLAFEEFLECTSHCVH